MKHIIAIQTLLLLITVAFGLGLKTGMIAAMTGTIHKTPGILAMVFELITIYLVFKAKKGTDVKVISIVTFVLTCLAAFGGIQTESGSNYTLFYSIMAMSGFAAFILSSIMLGKLRYSK